MKSTKAEPKNQKIVLVTKFRFHNEVRLATTISAPTQAHIRVTDIASFGFRKARTMEYKLLRRPLLNSMHTAAVPKSTSTAS